MLSFELLLGHELCAGVLVQVKVKRCSLVEILVGLRDHSVTVRLNLLDLVQVLFQSLA